MHKADNLPPSCAVVTKSGNLNFVEPSGPLTGLIYLYLYLFTSVNEGFLDYRPKSILSQNQIGVLPLSLSFAYPVLNFPSKVHDVILFSGYSPVTESLSSPQIIRTNCRAPLSTRNGLMVKKALFQ